MTPPAMKFSQVWVAQQSVFVQVLGSVQAVFVQVVVVDPVLVSYLGMYLVEVVSRESQLNPVRLPTFSFPLLLAQVAASQQLA